MNNKAYVIFTRVPTPNKCKTRLTPTYTGQQASDLQDDLLADLLASAAQLPARGIDVLLAYSDERDPTDFLAGLPAFVDAFPQHGDDIGVRMNNAFADAFARGYQEVVLTGSDLPQLTAATIVQALRAMKEVVIGPSVDGGYYLIGARRGIDLTPLFSAEIDWGQSTVLRATLSRVAGHDVQLLAPQLDVDVPTDLPAVHQYLDDHNYHFRHWLEEENNE